MILQVVLGVSVSWTGKGLRPKGKVQGFEFLG